MMFSILKKDMVNLLASFILLAYYRKALCGNHILKDAGKKTTNHSSKLPLVYPALTNFSNELFCNVTYFNYMVELFDFWE